MPLNAPAPKSDFKPIDPGTYVARCYSVVDLGTHQEEWKGKPKDSRKVRITWELPTELKEFETETGKKMLPLVIGKEYTLSMGEKSNLRKDIQSWIGTTLADPEAAGFDVSSLVGMDCMISVAHKTSGAGKTYAIVQSVTRLLKGTTCPPQVNPSVTFNVYEWNQEVYDGLPNFMKERIDESLERKQKPTEELDF